jgi:hypothetical protein
MTPTGRADILSGIFIMLLGGATLVVTAMGSAASIPAASAPVAHETLVADGAIVGFRRPDQVDPILIAAGVELTDEDLNEIEGRH